MLHCNSSPSTLSVTPLDAHLEPSAHPIPSETSTLRKIRRMIFQEKNLRAEVGSYLEFSDLRSWHLTSKTSLKFEERLSQILQRYALINPLRRISLGNFHLSPSKLMIGFRTLGSLPEKILLKQLPELEKSPATHLPKKELSPCSLVLRELHAKRAQLSLDFARYVYDAFIFFAKEAPNRLNEFFPSLSNLKATINEQQTPLFKNYLVQLFTKGLEENNTQFLRHLIDYLGRDHLKNFLKTIQYFTIGAVSHPNGFTLISRLFALRQNEDVSWLLNIANFRPALYEAASQPAANNLPILQLLFRHHSDNRTATKALFFAYKSNHEEAIRFLLESNNHTPFFNFSSFVQLLGTEYGDQNLPLPPRFRDLLFRLSIGNRNRILDVWNRVLLYRWDDVLLLWLREHRNILLANHANRVCLYFWEVCRKENWTLAAKLVRLFDARIFKQIRYTIHLNLFQSSAFLQACLASGAADYHIHRTNPYRTGMCPSDRACRLARLGSYNEDYKNLLLYLGHDKIPELIRASLANKKKIQSYIRTLFTELIAGNLPLDFTNARKQKKSTITTLISCLAPEERSLAANTYFQKACREKNFQVAFSLLDYPIRLFTIWSTFHHALRHGHDLFVKRVSKQSLKFAVMKHVAYITSAISQIGAWILSQSARLFALIKNAPLFFWQNSLLTKDPLPKARNEPSGRLQ
ncbi:MAG: hypothetical protein AAGI90_02930 [Chlamydiota bacterium]